MSKRTMIKKKEKREEKRREAVKSEEKIAVGCRRHTGIFLRGVFIFSSVQLLNRIRLFSTPWITARQASLSITISRSSLRLTSIESVMPSTISSSVVSFSSCPQSLPASESFPMSQLFAWGSQSTGVSALASFLPKNTQGWLNTDFSFSLPFSSPIGNVWKCEQWTCVRVCKFNSKW